MRRIVACGGQQLRLPVLINYVLALVGKQLEPLTLEQPEHVDARRASVGLGPLAEHVAGVRSHRPGGVPS